MTRFFKFIKNSLHFFKMLNVFLILMLLLYWIKNLAQLDWAWLGFISPVLDIFLEIGKSISSDSINIWGAVFEYKYMYALITMLLLCVLTKILSNGVNFLEEVCDTTGSAIKKLNERQFNKSLQKKQEKEQNAIKNYRIYISTSAKKTFSHLGEAVDLDEQNKIMNKFIMEQLATIPAKLESGFLYSFNDFDSVDNTLNVFFRVLKSKAPVEYNICVQICSKNTDEDIQRLKTLIDLKFTNKISMLSDTAYRYSFNKAQNYKTTQLGLFQKGNNTIEAHEFVEN